MKNQIYSFMLGVSLISLGMISCENLIDVDLPANQIASDKVFADVQTADAALAAIYAGLWNNSPFSGDKMGNIAGICTDDLDFFATNASDGTFQIYKNEIIPSNNMTYSFWSSSYQLIYSCNAVIEGCNASVSLAIDDKKRITAEAILIRSILLFYLHEFFGEIPYPTTTNYTVNKILPKMQTVALLQLLETHLSTAAKILPDPYRNAERIYPNKKIAQLMLSKIYMEQKRWNEAESILKEVTSSSQFQFQEDITKVFKKGGSHILWQLKPRNNGDATKESYTYYFAAMPPYSYALSNRLMTSFLIGDLRKQHWTVPVTVAGTTWYRASKYKNISNNTDEYSVVFRLEEAYLLLAETFAQQGKIAQALPFVNATRQRAGLQKLVEPQSKDQLLNEILLEEQREFFAEMGHRFLDLKRHDKLSLLKIAKPNWQQHHDLWPIPEKELLLNPKLNPQNNGY